VTGAADRRERLRAVRAVIRTRREGFARPEVKADINVTPLVDVVLVLLIIFMVVTPMIASGVAVDLPRTANHSRKPDDGKDIIVSVTADGRTYVGTRLVSRASDLAGVVAAEQRRFPEKSLFLKGDQRARFGSVREALHTLREAKVGEITLGTEELETARK
jgi:biopolymer transport protein TolR